MTEFQAGDIVSIDNSTIPPVYGGNALPEDDLYRVNFSCDAGLAEDAACWCLTNLSSGDKDCHSYGAELTLLQRPA